MLRKVLVALAIPTIAVSAGLVMFTYRFSRTAPCGCVLGKASGDKINYTCVLNIKKTCTGLTTGLNLVKE